MMLFDPAYIAENLPYDSIVATRYLQFDHHVIVVAVQGQYVNESATDRKFEAVDPFKLIELESRFNQGQVF